jgi:hypothetical protein
MFAPNAERVSRNTAAEINERIRLQTEANVQRYVAAGPAAIERRLEELDHEWDIERYVETMAPTFTLIGTAMGLTVSRKWFLVPFFVQGFFLQHALQGWCPPIPLLRRLGVRTVQEIEQERCALKAIRGDFRHLAQRVTYPESAIEAVTCPCSDVMEAVK